jgi:hypothetical protein
MWARRLRHAGHVVGWSKALRRLPQALVAFEIGKQTGPENSVSSTYSLLIVEESSRIMNLIGSA